MHFIQIPLARGPYTPSILSTRGGGGPYFTRGMGTPVPSAPDNELSPDDGAGSADLSPTLTGGNDGEFTSCQTECRIYFYLNVTP